MAQAREKENRSNGQRDGDCRGRDYRMITGLGRGLEHLMDDTDLESAIPLPDDKTIPLDPTEFYKDFGRFTHPRTGKPVAELTKYQYEAWKGIFEYNKIFCLKSQKIGLTSALLLAAFQLAVLPSSVKQSCRGKQILVIAQTVTHAELHLRDLRRMIADSKKYSPFLITKGGTDELFADEATKTSAIYLRNPDNPQRPTTILALGITNSGTLLSF